MFQTKLISTEQGASIDNATIIEDYLFTMFKDSGKLSVRKAGFTVRGSTRKTKVGLEQFEIYSTLPNVGSTPDEYNKIAFDRINIAMTRDNNNTMVHAFIWTAHIFCIIGAYDLVASHTRRRIYIDSTGSPNSEEGELPPFELGKDYGAKRTADYLIQYDVIPRKFSSISRSL